jgi:serine/threonine protein kinase
MMWPMCPTMQALSHMHAQKVVHGDIKPVSLIMTALSASTL